jgi:hypothetical protein
MDIAAFPASESDPAKARASHRATRKTGSCLVVEGLKRKGGHERRIAGSMPCLGRDGRKKGLREPVFRGALYQVHVEPQDIAGSRFRDLGARHESVAKYI